MKTDEEIRAYYRDYYRQNRERILERVKKRQEEKHDAYIEYQRHNRAENLERRRQQSYQWKQANKERHLESSRRYSVEHAAEISKKRKEQRRQLKQAILGAYGGECACCGEAAFEFLTLDHINGDGATHRKALGIGDGRSHKLYQHLIDEGFPPGFRVLCFNCNSSLGFYGFCPHHPGDTCGVPPTRRGRAAP